MAIATLPGTTDIIAGPALLYYGTTGLDSESKYGTLLGLIDGPVAITPFYRTRETMAEPYAAEPLQEWKTAAYVEASARVHAQRAAAWAAGFPDAQVSAGFQFPGTVLPGGAMVGYAKKWLIMPLDDGAVNPVGLFQHGLARIDGKIEYASDRDLIIPIRIRSYRDPNTEAAEREWSHFVQGAKATVSSKIIT